LDATIIAFSNAKQACRVGDRKGAEHHGIDQRENRRRSADPERQREHRRRGKHRRQAEPSHRVAHIADQSSHRRRLL
jgi:hypothetical protein